MSIPATVRINGIIEGFYWSAPNQVKGQFKFFSKTQRDQLISSMSEGLNYYFYAPQDTEDHPFTMKLWDSQQAADWSDTVSKASNVSIVMGLRPRWIDSVQTSLQAVKLKLTQFALVGIHYYILCWDDTEGAGTTAQMKLQRDLIKALVLDVTNIELIGIIPAYYSRSQISGTTNAAWGQQISILNQIPNSIRFFVTGLTVVPSSIQTSDIPTLTNRQFIFFDNWIAVDSSTKVTMSWPPNRHSDIYNASASISGSVLNLAFPPERIIHQIYATIQRINNKYSYINSRSAAVYWSQYLLANHFYRSNSSEQLETNLQLAIDNLYETTQAIIQRYPLLSAIFTN
ncbi:unnamed protein product [Didymodactylos carnosus]|uniref:GH84 domain-containing protein n=1 Tax=Didymodactylos carnosus TaxID=1234261 RepID=A0A8S2QLK9_9BILA|nr:unnamed protein product [Didymodactylos carnosus]CAF4105688.1 unnamed protein product [Didymodactylos carnosus]